MCLTLATRPDTPPRKTYYRVCPALPFASPIYTYIYIYTHTHTHTQTHIHTHTHTHTHTDIHTHTHTYDAYTHTHTHICRIHTHTHTHMTHTHTHIHKYTGSIQRISSRADRNSSRMLSSISKVSCFRVFGKVRSTNKYEEAHPSRNVVSE